MIENNHSLKMCVSVQSVGVVVYSTEVEREEEYNLG